MLASYHSVFLQAGCSSDAQQCHSTEGPLQMKTKLIS